MTTESFAALYDESVINTNLQAGTILDAEVIEIVEDFVTVSAGLKSESDIPIKEFLNDEGKLDIQVGDHVKVGIVEIEVEGYTVLSRELAKRNEAWELLNQAYEDNAVVLGKIANKVKGGFAAEVFGIRAFLPGSLIDVRPQRDTYFAENQEIELKVIKLDRKRNNIVVSRRAVLESENNADRAATLEGIEEQQVIKGIVKNLTDYGAFVDLGGIDGLLHKTDISWTRVNHPSEALTVGQEIDVVVLKLDRERGRVSLGMKQLGDDPWVGLATQYPAGSNIKGQVTNVTDYGCFVEIAQGVEGLVHQSEMDWTNKNIAPSKLVHVGDEVEVKVLEIDEDRRRISLGIKQCIANPWETFVATHNKGDKITGNIRSITDFGIFIGLPGDIDGLVHLSDISWSESPEAAIRDYKKGQEVEAVILAMDAERERISLGVKQLSDDSFGSFIAVNDKGSTVTGTVKEVDAKNAIVELAPEVLADLKAAEISRERVEDVRTALNVGDTVEAKIINIDKKNRTISISIKAQEMQDEADATREYSRKAENAKSSTTLGDLLKGQMQSENEGEDKE